MTHAAGGHGDADALGVGRAAVAAGDRALDRAVDRDLHAVIGPRAAPR